MSPRFLLVLFILLLLLVGISGAATGTATGAATRVAAGIGAGAAVGAGGPPRGSDPARIDDFEDGDLIAANGSAWVPIGDDLFGGATTMSLEPRRGGAHGSRGALRIAARIGEAPGSVAGAWTAVVAGARPADVGGFSGLRLSLRGEGEVLVGVRRGTGPDSDNFMARATAEHDWRSIEIPFSRLEAQGKGHEGMSWDPRDAYWVGVSSVPGAKGAFAVDIDDVAWITAPGSGAAPRIDPGAAPMTRDLTASDPAPLRALAWRELASDPEGDGRKGLPDARALFVARDPKQPVVWFRLDLRDPVPTAWFGVNLVIDADGDPANGTAWWGKNNTFHYDRLVTAWLFRVGEGYQGTVGIASSEEVAAGRMTNDADVRVAVDRHESRIYLGIPASTLTGDAARVVAAVGSAMVHSDDIPDQGGVAPGGPVGAAPGSATAAAKDDSGR